MVDIRLACLANNQTELKVIFQVMHIDKSWKVEIEKVVDKICPVLLFVASILIEY